MSIEEKDDFLNMALTSWEEHILIDENHGVLERENEAIIPYLCWNNNNINNGDQEDQRELFSNEIVIGSLVEAAALLGLEDDDDNNNNNNIIINYGEIGKASNNINGDIVEASNAKKEEHNAKERERRMKLSQTFLSLRSLLPNARRSKKRWSTSTIIDKVVDYIPTLQKEIENLNQKKNNLIKAKDTKNNNYDQRGIIAHENQGLELFHHHNPTISIHQLCKGDQVIIQICMHQTNIVNLSTLIHKAQAQGLRIIGASAVSVSVPFSDDCPTLTCHLHFQVNTSLQEAGNYESILRKRVISWLC